MRKSTDIKSQESYKDNKADVKLIWRGRIGLIIMTMKATFFLEKKHSYYYIYFLSTKTKAKSGVEDDWS